MNRSVLSLIFFSIFFSIAVNSKAGQNLVVDVAWNGSTFKIDRAEGSQEGQFGGMHYTISGLVYRVGVLSSENCGMVSSCGWQLANDGSLEPQSEDQIIGRITTSGWFITGDHVDAMISALTRGDIDSFISTYQLELGKITSKVSNIIEFSEDETALSDQIVMVEGMIGTVLPGEKLTLVATAASGVKKRGRNQKVKMEMKALLNASGAQSFSLELPVERRVRRGYEFP